jgi:hypothetical protein
MAENPYGPPLILTTMTIGFIEGMIGSFLGILEINKKR